MERSSTMIRSLPQRLMGLALFAALSASAAATRADDAANISLDEIAQRLTEWRGSFANLRVVWELKSLPESTEPVVEWPPPPNAESGSLFSRVEWIWADHGLDLLEDHTFFYDDGSSKEHQVDVFNGPKGLVFRAVFHRPADSSEQLKTLRLRGLGVGKPTSSIVRAPVNGLYWPSRAAWLPELLSAGQFKLEAIEKVGAEPCARIVTVGDEGNLLHTIWLGMDHDYLVRRLRTTNASYPSVCHDYVFDEFQRLDGDVWFPKRGRIQLRGIGHEGTSVPTENQIFVITEAAVNQPLDLKRFDPPAPQVGTVVDDHGRSYRHGVSGTGAGEAAATNSTSQMALLPTSAAPPPPSWFWSAVLGGMSLTLLVAGLWFSSRKKEPEL